MTRRPKYPKGVRPLTTLEITANFREAGLSRVGVHRIAWSSAGDRLATLDNTDAGVRIWSPNDGKLIRRFEGAGGTGLLQLTWSPDDRFIASGPPIRLFDAETGQRDTKSFADHHGAVTCIAWSPSGNCIATGAEDTFVALWDSNSGKLKASLEGHKETVSHLAWHPAGKLLASASPDDHTIILWSTDSELEIWKYRVAKRVWNLTWLPDGKLLLVGHGNSFCLLEVESGTVTGQIHWDHEPRSVALSSDGALLAAGWAYHREPVRLGLWFCGNWQHILTAQDVEESWAASTCVSFHPRQCTLAIVVAYGLIRILELDTEELRLIQPQQVAVLSGTDADPPEIRPGSQPGMSPPIKRQPFDVFCCYNSTDRPAVERIAQELKQRGLLPWLDQWQLRPGLPWQDELQNQVRTARSVAVFVGKRGFGPWQSLEAKAFIEEFTKRGCPVIPVLLPDFDSANPLPPFLAGMTWVDFRSPDPDPLDRLTFGITGSH